MMRGINVRSCSFLLLNDVHQLTSKNDTEVSYMKSGWTYSNDSGNREKLAPNTLVANVQMAEDGPGLLDFIRDYTHPVGSIWMTSGDQDPNVLFGGTWTKMEDVFLLASGENVPAGTTGGEAAHTLTTEELPVHRHSAYGNDTSSGWFFSLIKSISGRSGKLAMAYGTERYGFASNNTYSDLDVQNQTGTAGEGYAHNNMPPYRAVNVWERTA